MKTCFKPEMPTCIDNDADFANEVRKYTDQIADCQLKVGELVYYYIGRHGNTYGDRTFRHIIEITGIPDSTLRNYHNLYRLEQRHKDFPTLGNLSLGVKYQIGRLLDCPDADTLVPKLIERAATEKSTAARMATEVSDILERQKTEEERKRRAEQTDDRQTVSVSDPSPLFTWKDMKTIGNAATALTTLARDDVRKEAKVQDSMVDEDVVSLADGILRYIEKRVSNGQAKNLEPTIALLHDRFDRLYAKLNHGTKKTKKTRKTLNKGGRR